MQYLSSDDVKKQEIGILKCVLKYFSLHHISYSITAGTLLGAVRHGGFIPWDDDIDLMIERSEYLKLIEVLKNDPIEIHYSWIRAIGFELGNSQIPYLKFVNNTIMTEMSSGNQYLWIDIFPADAIPDRGKAVYYRIVKTLYTMYWLKTSFNEEENSFVGEKERLDKRLFHKFLRLSITPLSLRTITNLFIKYVSKYHNQHTVYLSNNIWGVFDREEFPRALMESFMLFKFEDIDVVGMKRYDEWLKIRYGDYMQLPPENERVNHGIKAYYINDYQSIGDIK